MSTRELARKLGYAKLNNTLSVIVKRLVAEGLVRLANPKQTHSPNQLLILQ